jgi:hypothetical protein
VLHRQPVGLLDVLPSADPAVAHDGPDDEGDQDRRRHEEADRPDDAQSIGRQQICRARVQGTGHPCM